MLLLLFLEASLKVVITSLAPQQLAPTMGQMGKLVKEVS